MKISKSKQELARIISENGGWRDGNYAVQDKDDKKVWFMRALAGRPNGASFWPGVKSRGIPYSKVLTNWHQTILSRAEYFHLYPAPDADGWIEWLSDELPVTKGTIIDVKYSDGDELHGAPCGVETENLTSIRGGVAGAESFGHSRFSAYIIAYRLHKPEQAKCAAVGDDETNLAAKEELEAMEYQPSIEQLAGDYRNKLAIATQSQAY